ncbi:T9SS type A sorting domain-containing protein [Pontibacter kalidii]|uniref:T9SS type A sorting domain-containing protein n=1 Tax=Pontibacter kalidii TaxID=2592049 RepID=UPI002259FDE8|nr:T9SS type A sorting domain-containing protein [Pontibacter kalidii]
MKQIILSLFTCFTVLFVQAQAKAPVQVQETRQQAQADKNPLGLQQDEDVAIYPNPSNGVFTISVSNLEAQEVELTILNVIGNEIYRETIKRTEPKISKTINLDRHAKGLYYVKLEADNYSAVRRVVIK